MNNNRLNKKNAATLCVVSLAITFLLSVVSTYCFGFGLRQTVVLASLILAIYLWATDVVPNMITSTVFLAILVLCGETPLKETLSFVFSQNLVLVISAYLLSQGLTNSNTAKKFSSLVFGRFCRNGRDMVIAAFVLNFTLGLVIPQASSRTILLAAIFYGYLEQCKIEKRNISVVLLSVFVASTFTSRALLNSDVIINYSALKFGSILIDNLEWIKLMFVPTLVASTLVLVIYIEVFKQNLDFSIEKTENATNTPGRRDGKKVIVIMAVVLFFWFTEHWHGINPAVIASAGVLAMFLLKVLRINDLRAININVILSLTAQFAAGAVLTNNGTAKALGTLVARILPASNHLLFLPIVLVFIILIHFFVGSIVTALAVAMPVMTPILATLLPTKFAALFVLCGASLQYVLPFHHITMMLGFAGGYYDSRLLLRFVPALTLLMLLTTLFIYLPWWTWVG